MIHRAEEDYLKIIYKLTVEEERELVKTNEIAEVTGYADQTVNEMVKRLEKKKMITFLPYKGVILTKKGATEAKRLVRNHRLWENFLVEKLNYSWIDVHDEAENLEHASSDLLMDRIDLFLNEPDYCVHGNAIPKKDGRVASTYKKPLKSVDVGEIFIVKRIVDQLKLMEYLNKHKLYINDKIIVVNKDDFNAIITVSNRGHEFVVSNNVADKIFGEVERA